RSPPRGQRRRLPHLRRPARTRSIRPVRRSLRQEARARAPSPPALHVRGPPPPPRRGSPSPLARSASATEPSLTAWRPTLLAQADLTRSSSPDSRSRSSNHPDAINEPHRARGRDDSKARARTQTRRRDDDDVESHRARPEDATGVARVV